MPRPTSLAPTAVCCLLVFASVGLGGCATLIHGSSQEVTVESAPSEAQVEVDGRPVGETPTTAILERDREYAISIYQEGYEPYHTTLRPGRSLWATVNVLNFFIPGLLIDASTGALHALDPGTVAPELQPVDSSAVDLPTPDEREGETP
ncbi:PEGA domain-containing protein [Salinibacter altiplanensis]|uniref:PEGA domain-containing protein n=1 Tax=Salinibacter altiplanensis TaxID=1803181 RepID=UPI000C9F1C45|nr:PEGA domain-containing protein [Salinibacter altiplanensis]